MQQGVRVLVIIRTRINSGSANKNRRLSGEPHHAAGVANN
jgi:hypothetical protein